MSGTILRWGLPALLTVVGGTALAVSTTNGAMTGELTGRAAEALASDWASVEFDSRDAVLIGTATDQQMIDDAIARLAAVPGVRSVNSQAVLAESVSPFPFSASIAGGRITLTGGIPDEALHREILEAVGTDVVDDLRLISGAPPRAAWRTAVLFALDQLTQLEEGEVSLADLDLSVAGRARDFDAHDDLLRATGGDLPESLTLASTDVVAPLVEPFVWEATFDGAQVLVSGFAPNADFADELRAGLSQHRVATSLRLASGAPEDFEESARTLLNNLVLLEEGRAEISGSTLSLVGAPPDAVVAARVEGAMARIDADLTLEPPRVASYVFTATRAETGLVLGGHVPDVVTRDRLAARDGVDASALGLGRGAPARFESAVEFGLGLLSHMSEGRFDIVNTTLSIEGRAATVRDFEDIETALALGAPQGLVLSTSSVKPPVASPFTWSAVKSEQGGIKLSGHVPSREARARLQTASLAVESDTTIIADGNPPEFEAHAGAGLGALSVLEEGALGFDGRIWSLTGRVASAADRLVAESRLVGTESENWRIVIEAPETVPVAAPYRWEAVKDAAGGVTLSGYVTSEEIRNFIAVRAGDAVTDSTEVASGEPAGFISDALAGLEALNHLVSGTVRFEDGSWSLAGTPQTAEEAEMALAALATATSGGASWQKRLAEPLEVPPPEPIEAIPAEPEPILPVVEDAALPDEPAPVPEQPAPAPVVRNYTFVAAKPLGGAIVLEGRVSSAETGALLAEIAGAVPTDNLEVVAEGLPPNYPSTAAAGVRLLAGLPSGEFGLDGDEWILTARAESETERAAVLARLSSMPLASGWQTDITILPQVDVCRQKIAALATRNAILFQSGSARLAEESMSAIDELAAYLELCPDAVVHIEGHTDTDGAAELNLALSVARAETVVDALIERGIAFQRLYAVGYGETLPVADNATAAGKRANRRIAFTILDQHE